MIRPIEGKDQEPLAGLIRSVFEEYGAPLLNTVMMTLAHGMSGSHCKV